MVLLKLFGLQSCFTSLYYSSYLASPFYSLDEIVDPAVTVKAIGHQWYWV
jgi:hypothetical protein